MLNLPWNKEQDTDSIEVPSEQARLTKQGILAKLAEIYYPLGLISQRHFVVSSFITLFVIQREQHGKGLGKVGEWFATNLRSTMIACHSSRGD